MQVEVKGGRLAIFLSGHATLTDYLKLNPEIDAYANYAC